MSTESRQSPASHIAESLHRSLLAWRIRNVGRIAGSVLVVAGAATGPAQAVTLTSVTRSVAYTYDPTSGQVLTEQVDPGLDHCVEKDYGLDGYGNRHTVTVKPCASTAASASFPARVTTNDYLASSDAANTTPPASGFSYPAGAFLTHSASGNVSATLAESRAAYDPRFGSATSQVAVAMADSTKNLAKRTQFDALGRVVREYAPVKRNTDGSVIESYVQYSYVSCYPTPTSNCLALSSTISVTYDSGRLVDSSGNPTSTAAVPFVSAYYVEATPYDATNTVIGAVSRTHYDALNREIAKESQGYDGSWTRTLTGYDQLGLTAVTYGAHTGRDTAGNVLPPPADLAQWTAERDLTQRPIDQRQMWRGTDGAQATPLVARLNYNGLESIATTPASSTPDGIDRVTRARKSPLGQVAQSVNADGATLNSAYDAAGNLVTTVDALGNTITNAFTPVTARFKVSTNDPDMGLWSYAYDALGQLTQQTDARLVVTRMSYDDLGRLINKSTPNFVSKWYYDKNTDGTWCAYGLGRMCYSQLGATTPVDSQKLEYDSLARPYRSTTTLDRAYVSVSTFDDLGRPSTLQYPTGLTLRYGYSAAGSGRTPGVLQQVYDNASPSRIFWRIDSLNAGQVFDAQGHLVKSVLGNTITTDSHVDPISGKIFALNAGTGGSTTNVAAQSYTWDQLGNLKSRQDGITAVSDNFAYDVLGRLIADQLTSTVDMTATRTVTASYNAIGNLLSKSDVGGYVYGATVRPHAVLSADNVSYAYDANGSISGATGWQQRTHAWNDFNQPDSLTYNGNRTDFSYDADYKRVKEVATKGGTTRTLYLLHPDNVGGLGFEREETRVNGALTRNESRHYITVGGAVIGVVKTLNDSGTVSTDDTLTNYWLKDSLGSITTVASASGVPLERMAFDAWGRRISTTGKVDSNLVPANGHRGFTGHEELDELALVHMNGRVYDPALGRFLSADSIIESPSVLQSFNRYSYVLNNPLRYTDASGHCVWDFCIGEAAAIFAAFAGYALYEEGNSNWKMVGTVVMAVAGSELAEAGLGNAAIGNNASAFVSSTNTFTVGGYGNAFVSSFSVSMLTTGGNLQASTESALFALAFTAAGLQTNPGSWEKFATHALIGCIQTSMSGGACGPGAASAFVGEGASWIGSDLDPLSQGFVATVGGGTASVIGGGKFSSGAYQAGFAYIFNDLFHNAQEARSKYGGGTSGKGHHWIPFGSFYDLDVSADAGMTWGQSVSGEPLPGLFHDNHPRYTAAVKDELVKWSTANNIDLSKMTVAEAQAFEQHIMTSNRFEIASLRSRIQNFMSKDVITRRTWRWAALIGMGVIGEMAIPSPERSVACHTNTELDPC